MIIVHLKKDGIKMEMGMALASEDANVVKQVKKKYTSPFESKKGK